MTPSLPSEDLPRVYTRDEDLPFRPDGNDARINGNVERVKRTSGSDDSQLYARKTLTIDKLGNEGLEDVRRKILHEAETLRRARHGHVVELVETYFFESAQDIRFSMVMERADANLDTYLKHRTPPKNWGRLAGWFGCLIRVTAYIHTLGIQHRDIKPSHILIKDGRILLTGFDISQLSRGQTIYTRMPGFAPTRSPEYCAPEVEDGSARGRPADIFSLGAVFLEMLIAYAYPQERRHLEDKLTSIGYRSYAKSVDRIDEFMSRIERELRPDKWFLKAFSYCRKMLNTKPDQRPLASELNAAWLALTSLDLPLVPCTCSMAGFQLSTTSGSAYDASSLFDARSITTSVDFPDDLREPFIDYFSKSLYERVCYSEALQSISKVPSSKISDFIRQYAVDLEESAKPGLEMNAARLVRRHRPHIVRELVQFTQNSSNLEMSSALDRLNSSFNQISASDKVRDWKPNLNTGSVGDLQLSDLNLDEANNFGFAEGFENENCSEISEEEKTELNNAEFEIVRKFMIAGPAFKALVERVQLQVLGEEQYTLFRIRCQVDTVLKTITPKEGRYTLGFLLKWELQELLISEFDEGQNIADVFTVSGSAERAQAETCGRYLQIHWPKLGLHLIESLQSGFEILRHPSRGGRTILDDAWSVCYSGPDIKKLEFTIEPGDRHGAAAILTVTGTSEILREVAQQLCWLASAFRHSRAGRVSGSSFNLQEYKGIEDTSDPTLGAYCQAWLQVSVLPLQPLLQDDRSCWHCLFVNGIVAKSFPIAPRQEEIGLEIPLAVMADLGGALYATEYDGGILLKGYSTGFVPVIINNESVQWHFHAGEPDTRLTAEDIVRSCAGWAKSDDPRFLQKRAFLGVWKVSVVTLATSEFNPTKVTHSGAKGAGRSWTITGGSIGVSTGNPIPGVPAVTGAVAVGINSSQTQAFLRSARSFERMMHAARDKPLILYDPVEKRAWLVPAICAMLAVAQIQAELYEIPGAFQPPRSELGFNGGEAAFRAIMQTMQVLLTTSKRQTVEDRRAEKDAKLFRDCMLNIWGVFERVIDATIKKGAPGVPLRPKNVLRGWEMMLLATSWPWQKFKMSKLERSSGGWLNITDDMVVLFCHGLGEVIRPADPRAIPTNAAVSNLYCRKWSLTPKLQDYLTASVICLAHCHLCGEADKDNHLNHEGYRWKRGEMVFEDCVEPAAANCKCNRLQEITKALERPLVLTEVGTTGAVIFGKKVKVTKIQKVQGSLFRLENVSINEG